MGGISDLFNGSIQKNWANDAGLSARLVIPLLVVTGLIYLSSKVISFLRLVLSLFVLPGKSIYSFGPPRSWALVTGASDGIGKEFALQLARARYSILLISRTASKLDALAQHINTLYPSVSTKTFAIDFASASPADYDRLEAFIKDLDIAVLVNNVGVSHDMPVPFLQTSAAELEGIITINCLATLRVTQLVAPGMVRRKRGLILTMGSFAGLLPSPLLATYSGSKAFLQYWSSALGAELLPHGITVELVQSYLVTSAMSKVRRPSALVPSPRGFVAAVLAKVGRAGGAQGWAYTSAPYWSHGLMAWAVNMIGNTGQLGIKFTLNMHEGIRKRALRKQEREKERERIAGKKTT